MPKEWPQERFDIIERDGKIELPSEYDDSVMVYTRNLFDDGKTCTGYEDAEEMLANEDLDCIVVATPDFVHHKYSIMGLEAGKDLEGLLLEFVELV